MSIVKYFIVTVIAYFNAYKASSTENRVCDSRFLRKFRVIFPALFIAGSLGLRGRMGQEPGFHKSQTHRGSHLYSDYSTYFLVVQYRERKSIVSQYECCTNTQNTFFLVSFI